MSTLDTDGLDLPSSVKNLASLAPVENVLLEVFRDAMPDMLHVAQIPKDIESEMARFGSKGVFGMVRRHPGWGLWAGRPRLLDQGSVSIHIFTDGDIDSDERAAIVADAYQTALYDAWIEGSKYYPGIGSLVRARVLEEPLRKTDWATSVGPVQYADLPEGWFRYEIRAEVWIRPPLWG